MDVPQCQVDTGRQARRQLWPFIYMCDPDLWATNLVHMLKTPYHWGKHLCQVILKSLYQWPGYSPDKQSATFDIWSVCLTLTFELPNWFMPVTRHLIEVKFVLCYFKIPLSMAKLLPGQAKGQFWLLTFICDLDPWAMDLVHACDMPSYWGLHFCLVILKSFHPWPSYSSDKQSVMELRNDGQSGDYMLSWILQGA